MSNAARKMKMKGNHWVWHHDSHSDLDKNSLWRTVSENSDWRESESDESKQFFQKF